MGEENKLEYENIQVTKQVESFQQFIELAENSELTKASFLIPTEMFVVTDNLRPFNQNHIDRLARSIEDTGQKTPCIGDIVWDQESECWRPRLIAGQHRYKAIQKINEKRRKQGLCEMPLWITLENRTYDPYEVIDIQLAENIHEKMTSSEEGFVLYGYYRRLHDLMQGDDCKLTISDFAKRVGRDAETVRNAIKFVEGLDPRVQKLVDEKKLPYTHALLLVALPKEGTQFMTTQYEIAEHIYREKLGYNKVQEIVKNKKLELGFVGPLFGGDWEIEKVREYVINLSNTSGQNAKEAGQWFARVIESLERYEDESKKVLFATSVENSILSLGKPRENFIRRLKKYVDPELYNRVLNTKI